MTIKCHRCKQELEIKENTPILIIQPCDCHLNEIGAFVHNIYLENEYKMDEEGLTKEEFDKAKTCWEITAKIDIYILDMWREGFNENK